MMLVTRREIHAKLTAGNLKQGAALSNQNGAIVTTVRLSSGTSQQIIIPPPSSPFPFHRWAIRPVHRALYVGTRRHSF